jgi:hypothetical protein
MDLTKCSLKRRENMHPTRRQFITMGTATLLVPDVAFPQSTDVEKELSKQLKIAARKLHKTGNREYALQMSVLVRVAVADSKNFDRKIQKRLLAMGKNAFMDLKPDNRKLHIDFPDVADFPVIPADISSEAYDRFVREGITPTILELASELENAQFAGVVPATCGQLSTVIYWTGIVAAGSGIFAPNPIFVASTAMYVGFSIAYGLRCM